MATRPATVPGVEARAGRSRGPSLIPALNAIQDRLGWLPREELERLARETRRPLYEVQGLVSFYPHFRTDPPPPVSVQACHDLSCWLRGGEERIAGLRSTYDDDPDVEVLEVSCPGRCDLAPVARVNERTVGVDETAALVESVRSGSADRASHAEHQPPHGWPNDPYADGEERYEVLRSLLAGELTTEAVLDDLKASGLRGMGGAGFPTGDKWALVAGAAEGARYAVCNADESEPGTFKDRQLLAEQAHLVLEGMLLGMLVAGAEEGWVFVRHEYGPEEVVLHAELERLRVDGLLGDDVLGTGRRLSVEVFTSPGGYILGEETALLECIEGHRGEPRNKPPFPGTYGLWGRPTLMNSVETFAHVPGILRRGPGWWRDQGVNGSTGLKFFAVSGHVERPGVYCVPMGTTVRDLLDRAGGVLGGAELGAVQPGGASSNFLRPDQIDVPLDFTPLAEAGSMLGSGAVVVMAEGTNLLAAATNVLRFFRDESCGKCVPCRVGSAKAHELLVDDPRLAAGEVADANRDRLVELETVMRRTSICGLGQVALGPVVSVLGLDRGATAARPHPRG
ncbi:MAG TPA: NAD(P)H-dependent oxidoreductase subunit E [Jiangellales bacterium]|nr:NAD(P)H-dependent oxidoreductase subunit E [Jiangellales bacterium]